MKIFFIFIKGWVLLTLISDKHEKHEILTPKEFNTSEKFLDYAKKVDKLIDTEIVFLPLSSVYLTREK